MSLFSRLTRRQAGATRSGPMRLEQAHRIVEDFGDFLRDSPPPPGRIADVGELPYPKAQIEQALVVCIKAVRDPEIVGHLENGYLMLSAWQPGGGGD